MTGLPLVSIVIPVYNGADYLREAVDSALAQSYPNVEVIVVNDGSSDGGATEAIALSYGNRIRYASKENGGVATALNLAIGMMKGEYFSWLSHDDVYLPEKIERQVAQLRQYGRDVILYCDYNFIDEASRYLSTKRIKAPHPSEFRLALLHSHPVHGCTLLIPRRFLLEAGLFDEALRTSQDYDLWFRLARRHEFIHVPDVLINSRKHAQQGTQAARPLFMTECAALYLGSLRDVLTGWDRGEAARLVFLIKAAVFLERCRHREPLRYCKEELRRSLVRAFPFYHCRGWYWTMFYVLFRAKRLVWK